MTKKHCILSPSSAHRWVECAGSVNAQKGIVEIKSEAAENGSNAHELAAIKLKHIYGIEFCDQLPEVNKYIEGYIQYIGRFISGFDPKSFGFEIDLPLDSILPSYVEDRFGTVDAFVIENDILHIFDFKYGFSRVCAYENYQLLMYAIGWLSLSYIDVSYTVRNITLHIAQPRINHYDSWTLSRDELMVYAGYIKARAIDAMQPDAKRKPSKKACKFCKARSVCPALRGVYTKIIEDCNIDSDVSIKFVLDNAGLVRNYISSIEDLALSGLKCGVEVKGYKLVRGRRTRRLEDGGEEILHDLYGDSIYRKSLLPFGKLKEVLDEEHIKLFPLTEGNLILVPDSDKRSAVQTTMQFESVLDD